MHYYSHTDIKLKTTFKDALLASLANDGGLWMPSVIPSFSESELINLAAMNFSDCAAYLSEYFVCNQLNNKTLNKICHDAYNFKLPIKTTLGDEQNPNVTSSSQDYILELFHGPTLAFKDFAARFMARCTSELLSKSMKRKDYFSCNIWRYWRGDWRRFSKSKKYKCYHFISEKWRK